MTYTGCMKVTATPVANNLGIGEVQLEARVDRRAPQIRRVPSRVTSNRR